METNVASRVDDFVHAARDLANVTRGNDIMFTMGTDFTYANAITWCPRSCYLPSSWKTVHLQDLATDW